MNEKRWLQVILTLVLALGVLYALLTPPFEASDELWHYPMIRHLADGNPLPVQVYDPALAGPWKQEASQPPLYYYLGAALTFWIDTSDMERVRWLNPHVDNGVVTVDGNRNLAIHPETFSSWQGTLLAVRLVRLFSVLLGVATVYLTYLIGREALPDRPEIALGAAALNGFTPMFLFISGAVNNDNLALPLASLGLLLLIRLITRCQPGESLITAAGKIATIGAVIGLAVLTKQGTIGLLPLAWGSFVIWEWRRAGGATGVLDLTALIRVVLRSLADFALLMLPVVLIAGWWYWRNVALYGDLLGWSAFIAVLGERETAAPLAQLWDERWGFMLSYWGLFGGVNVPMWSWSYYLLNGLAVAAIPGGLFFAWRLIRRWLRRPEVRPAGGRLAGWLDLPLRFVHDHFGLVVCFLFAAAVIYGLIQWATTTWSSQGRLVFTAISALNLLWAVGLAGWLPPRAARRVLGGTAAFLAGLAALAPTLFITPTYRAEAYQYDSLAVMPCTAAVCFPEDERPLFGERLALLGYTVAEGALRPGEPFDLVLEWGLGEADFERDWSVFVHLNDTVLGVPIAQRDMYLGQGLLPTSLLDPGDKVSNRYRLFVPATAVAPAELNLTVGLYDFETGERLLLNGGGDHLVLEKISLEPAAGDLPNPVRVNFEEQFELAGFTVEPRRARPGETVRLTLYWRPLAPAPVDYTFFAQVVDPDTTRWAAADLGQPTRSWPVGELQTVEMELLLREDTPAGVYPLRLGIYHFTEAGGFENLQTVTADGRLTDDFINLTLIRID